MHFSITPSLHRILIVQSKICSLFGVWHFEVQGVCYELEIGLGYQVWEKGLGILGVWGVFFFKV